MASLDSLMILTFARITRTEEEYAAQKLLENGGNLNAALDAHYRLEDCANIASGCSSPESEDESIPPVQGENFPREHLIDSSRRIISFADDLRAIASDNLVGRTTGTRDLVETPVEMRYDAFERRGHTSSVLPSNDLLHSMNDFGEELKAIRLEENAAEFYGYEPFARHVHKPSVPPIHTSLHAISDLEEGIKGRQHALAGHRKSHLQDPYLAHAISLSLETAEKEKQLREKASRIGELRSEGYEGSNVEQRQMRYSSSGVEARNTSYHSKPDDEDSMSRGFPAAPRLINASDFDEWSTLQEATMIGQVPESRYRSGTLAPHTPLHSVDAQRRMWEKQELEKQLTEKEASFPPDSAMDDENTVTHCHTYAKWKPKPPCLPVHEIPQSSGAFGLH
ncbi:PREDICTED: uncharacterized protein LOC104714660 [Camelina sativa]|uniref:Uncharacterized protein LOC104714660 n=1 Tax=Camelina sativa TaxID=90675 RepID=A0ABM0TS22_CAMSA|nr:PREDICTED: uncharacterized protein LOC104714660 [Camelina sativa]